MAPEICFQMSSYCDSRWMRAMPAFAVAVFENVKFSAHPTPASDKDYDVMRAHVARFEKEVRPVETK